MPTYTKPKLQYPIHDVDDYKGRIVFTAVRENFETLGGAIATVAKRRLVGNQTGPDQVISAQQRLESNEQASALNGSPETATIKPRSGSTQTLGSIQLYLPNQLIFGDAAEYTNVDLGIVGGAVALGLKNNDSGSALAKALLQNTLPSLDSLYDAAVNGLQSETAQVAALRVASKLGQGVQGAVETETGVTLNPNRRSTFRGIGLRRFSFNFQLVPTSAQEAHMIKVIVAFLREQLYPETAGNIGSLEGVSAAFKFPSKFKIKLLYGDRSSGVTRVGTGILPSFLERMSVTYNPNAMAFHTDGNPQETQITLSFLEERALTKSDIVADNLKDKIAFS